MHSIPSIKEFLKPYLRDNKKYLWVFLITVLVAAFETSFQAYLMKWVIDGVTNTAVTELVSVIFWPALLYVSMDLYHNLTMRAYLFACMKMYPSLKVRIIQDLFQYTSKHSVNFFQTNLAGDIASKIQDVSTNAEPLIRNVFEGFIARIATPAVVAVFLLSVSWQFSLAFVVWTGLFVFITIRLAAQVGAASYVYASTKNRMSGRLIDVIANMVTAKIFGQTKYEEQHLDWSLSDIRDSEVTLEWTTLRLHFYQGLMTFFLLAMFMIMLVHGRINGTVSVGDFAFVLTLLITSLGHVYVLGQAIGDSMRKIGEFRQALNALMLAHDVVDKIDAKPLSVVKGNIEFQQIDFGFSPDKLLFDDLSLTIRGGSKIGIVGSSGAGKSTFINLLLRLFEPFKGRIVIDGQSIDCVTLDSLRQNIALVPQQVDLFHRSIMDNIRYGNLEATEKEIVTAAKLAECHEFIEELPDKYHTLVGERGMKLSGGQKQRLAIARAYLKPAKILVMDEATSALDSITERYIQRALTHIMQGKTTFIIAHRLATLKQVDRILVFEQGRIVEQGALAELIDKKGKFSEMWNEQHFIEDEVGASSSNA